MIKDIKNTLIMKIFINKKKTSNIDKGILIKIEKNKKPFKFNNFYFNK
jgi:hypothetical protein